MFISPIIKRISFSKAAAILVSVLAAVVVALMVTAAAGSASAITVPERTLITVHFEGTSIQADLPNGKSDQLVQVNGKYLHVDLDSQSVEEGGWKISKLPIDPASPIQAYDLEQEK